LFKCSTARTGRLNATKFYHFKHLQLSPAVALSYIHGRRSRTRKEIREDERGSRRTWRCTNEYTNVASRIARLAGLCLSQELNLAFIIPLHLSPFLLGFPVPVREFAGFLLFSRRVPLCTPDKAPRRRSRCFIRDIWQYPNERSTGETTLGGGGRERGRTN